MEQTAHQHSRPAIRGAERLTPDELRDQLDAGARCVRFEWCASVLVATFRFRTATYLTGDWVDRFARGVPFAVLSLLLGPWAMPWGPILTVRTVVRNACGGVCRTARVRSQIR